MQPSYVPYLCLNDYLLQIRSGQLSNQLLDPLEQGGDFERKEAESFALDEVRSILGSYFYLDFEFRSLLPYNSKKKYYAGDRIIIDFPLWVAAEGGEQDESEDAVSSYSVGDCVILAEDLNGYICTTENADRIFNPNNWQIIGAQYDIYFVNFPYPIFQLIPQTQIGISTPGIYIANISKVCWEKHLYLCRNNSNFYSHQFKEQFYEVNDLPSPNIFPNQPCVGGVNQQWIDKGEFFLKGITPVKGFELDTELNSDVEAWDPGYTSNWTFGDNRSATMKQIVIAIAISKLMGRNSFQLKERSINRDAAYRKLEAIRKGEATTLIPILQPEQVGDISWGGMPKVRNTF